MSYIWDFGTTEQLIPDYSDTTHHAKKSESNWTWPSRRCTCIPLVGPVWPPQKQSSRPTCTPTGAMPFVWRPQKQSSTCRPKPTGDAQQVFWRPQEQPSRPKCRPRPIGVWPVWLPQEQSNLNFAKKSIDATKTSSEDSEQTEDVFSPDQTDAILGNLRTFAKPDGLKITNCIFRRSHVEICYFFDDIADHHNKDELKQLLAKHLNIDSKLIKLTKLRAKPIYKETTLRPGDTATIHPRGLCKIGAFVEVEGKGNHALVSGHGKNQGDVLFYPNGHQFGTVNVSLQPTLQPNVGDNWCGFYTDVALVRLDEQAGYIPQVLDGIRSPLGLNEQPIDATNGMKVRRFAWDGRRGRVDSKDYNIWDDTYNIAFRLISVVREDGGPMHAEGDSGILIVTDTPGNGKVSAVGILVRLEEMYEDNEEHTVRVTSLAVPLPANFDALCNHPYCNGATIKFLN